MLIKLELSRYKLNGMQLFVSVYRTASLVMNTHLQIKHKDRSKTILHEYSSRSTI